MILACQRRFNNGNQRGLQNACPKMTDGEPPEQDNRHEAWTPRIDRRALPLQSELPRPSHTFV